MEYVKQRSKHRTGGVLALFAPALALFAGLSLATSVSHAQQPTQPTQQAPVAAKQKPPAKKSDSSWVKLCDDKPIIGAGGIPSKRTVCLTHHERLSAINGRVLVSAALRTIKGQEEQFLMVLVPLGVALPPGIQVRVDNEKKPIPLKFTFCHLGGCTAEAIVTSEIVNKFKKGGKIDVLAINNIGKTVGFPIPLAGFTKAYDGPPVDTKKYQQARSRLMKLIQSRQAELKKKAALAQKKKKAGAAPKPALKKLQ